MAWGLDGYIWKNLTNWLASRKRPNHPRFCAKNWWRRITPSGQVYKNGGGGLQGGGPGVKIKRLRDSRQKKQEKQRMKNQYKKCRKERRGILGKSVP